MTDQVEDVITFYVRMKIITKSIIAGIVKVFQNTGYIDGFISKKQSQEWHEHVKKLKETISNIIFPINYKTRQFNKHNQSNDNVSNFFF